jgi:hypothetical protein
MDLFGLDIFLWHQGIPEIPKEIGAFKLTMISSRGTRVYPPPAPDVELSDWNQCRYLSDSQVSDEQIDDLVNSITSLGHRWTKCQKLFKINGENQFSEAY